jgi:hypothetical protein
MMLSTDSQKRVDEYLAALRKELHELMDEDVRDIVEEIRFHIADVTSEDGSIAAALAALGSPAELAGRYRTDEMLKRARDKRPAVVVLRSVFHWATVSVAGLIVFALSAIGYSLGAGLVFIAGCKILWPRGTGLWEDFYPGGHWGLSLTFTSGAPPHHDRELLGWWLAPLGLIVGGGLVLLTFWLGRWTMRKLWRPRRVEVGLADPFGERSVS